MIPIYKSYLPSRSLTYAHDAIDSTWVSSKGKYIALAQEKLQEMLEAHREEFGNRSVVGGTELRGLTADEVQERITRRKQLDAQRVAQRIVQPQLVEKTDQLQRWGLIDPPVSGTFSQTDRDTSQAAPIPITRPTTPGRPFRR